MGASAVNREGLPQAVQEQALASTRPCSACGAVPLPGALFCHRCGQRRDPEGEPARCQEDQQTAKFDVKENLASPKASVDYEEVLEALRAAIYPARLEVSWALYDAETARQGDSEPEAVARGEASLPCQSAMEAESLVGRLSSSFDMDATHRLIDTSTLPAESTLRRDVDAFTEKDPLRSPSPSPAPGRGRPASPQGVRETRRPWLRCAWLPSQDSATIPFSEQSEQRLGQERVEAQWIPWPPVPALPGSDCKARKASVQLSEEISAKASPRARQGPLSKQAPSRPGCKELQPTQGARSAQPKGQHPGPTEGVKRWRSLASRDPSPDGGKLSRGYLNRLMAKSTRTERQASPWPSVARKQAANSASTAGQGPLPSPRASLLANQKMGAAGIANMPSLTLPAMGRPSTSTSPTRQSPLKEKLRPASHCAGKSRKEQKGFAYAPRERRPRPDESFAKDTKAVEKEQTHDADQSPDSHPHKVQAPDDASTVVAGLTSESAKVRQAAALALGSLGATGTSHGAKLAMLLKDPDAGVRRAVAIALGNFGKMAANHEEALQEASAHDSDDDVRFHAAVALGIVQATSPRSTTTTLRDAGLSPRGFYAKRASATLATEPVTL